MNDPIIVKIEPIIPVNKYGYYYIINKYIDIFYTALNSERFSWS